MNTMTCTTEDELDVLLARMNERGITPVVLGFDRNDVPFLAYGYAPGGDGWDCGLTMDDPHSGEFDYRDSASVGGEYKSIHRCDECGAFDRLPLSMVTYPVTVFHRVELPTASDSYPAGYPND